jgi:hypothetical protein
MIRLIDYCICLIAILAVNLLLVELLAAITGAPTIVDLFSAHPWLHVIFGMLNSITWLCCCTELRKDIVKT